ncbi:MAG: D-sedoheptulose 7-phosphate isomerase [Deltaproteobacteria bacterium]|nr:D-sedoheptulose 7-phosphate isomerase [Deltaproteobacteria bacterium]
MQRAFADSIAAKAQFLKEHLRTLETVIDTVAARLLAGNKVLFFGNGGSAADAQHLAAEFVNRFLLERPPLPAMALTTDTSILTSVGNDYGYAEVFAKQVKALGREGDVAVALSTSGNSPNVLRAVEACRKQGIITVGLTGGDGGKLGALVDHHLCVSASKLSPRIQETHILVGHVLCEMVDCKLFGRHSERA